MAKDDVEFDPKTDEPPLLASIRAYWERQRGARTMPRRRDIIPADMKPNLPHILLADVVKSGEDFRYRLIGSRLQDYFAGNPTGRLMSEALSGFGAQTVARTIETYRTVVTRNAPLRISGAGAVFGQGAKTFDALLTPLSDDGAYANMIFGTFTFVWDRAITHAVKKSDPGEAELRTALTA